MQYTTGFPIFNQTNELPDNNQYFSMQIQSRNESNETTIVNLVYCIAS